VSGITKDCLIKIPDLDLDLTRRICQRSQVSDVTVATDPNGRTAGKGSVLLTFKPLIEFDGIPTDVSVGRPRHFKISDLVKGCGTRIWARELLYCCHFRLSSITRPFRKETNLHVSRRENDRHHRRLLRARNDKPHRRAADRRLSIAAI
jgi:hypothetical protein